MATKGRKAEGREIKAMNDAARQVHRGMFNEWSGPRLRAPVTRFVDRTNPFERTIQSTVYVFVFDLQFLDKFSILRRSNFLRDFPLIVRRERNEKLMKLVRPIRLAHSSARGNWRAIFQGP